MVRARARGVPWLDGPRSGLSNPGKLLVASMTTKRTDSSKLLVFGVCMAAWAIPGAGHLLLKRGKGVVFMATLLLMFATGLALEGRLFSFRISASFDVLWAIGDLGIGLLYFIARSMGYGAGTVTAITYEYGNVFLVVAGILNAFVVLDAFDIAVGRK